jgi:hypothetical protein
MKLPNIFGPLSDYLQARVDLKKAKVTAEAQAYLTAAQGDNAWELIAAQKTGLLDEYWTAVLSVPLVLSFIPSAQPWIKDGFAALETAPDWYLWAVGASIGWAFARRRVPDFLGGALGKLARKG